MENAVVKTHLIPMLAEAGATWDVALAARLGATGTRGLCRPSAPFIGIDQTKVKIT